MNPIDSRHLNKYDSYTRRLDRPGKYRYRINYLGPGLEAFQSGPEYELVVQPSKREAQRQHSVRVSYDEKARHFRAEPPLLEVAAGDLVQWFKPDRKGGPFSVSGTSEEEVSFDSRRLDMGSIYSHTFLLPGVYGYRNTLGTTKEGAGTVRVQSAGPDRDAWVERLKQPALVVFTKGSFNPPEVEIVVGGTVVWAVQDDVGITVVVEEARREGRIIQRTIGRPRPRRGRAKE